MKYRIIFLISSYLPLIVDCKKNTQTTKHVSCQKEKSTKSLNCLSESRTTKQHKPGIFPFLVMLESLGRGFFVFYLISSKNLKCLDSIHTQQERRQEVHVCSDINLNRMTVCSFFYCTQMNANKVENLFLDQLTSVVRQKDL